MGSTAEDDQYVRMAKEAIIHMTTSEQVKVIRRFLRAKQQMIDELTRYDYDIGDLVTFEARGSMIEAQVVKINRKTLGVIDTRTGRRWRVPLSLCSPIVDERNDGDNDDDGDVIEIQLLKGASQ